MTCRRRIIRIRVAIGIILMSGRTYPPKFGIRNNELPPRPSVAPAWAIATLAVRRRIVAR
jgi:hypothetical protein